MSGGNDALADSGGRLARLHLRQLRKRHGLYLAVDVDTVEDYVTPFYNFSFLQEGRLSALQMELTRNGTKWRVYRCTNNTAGCQYAWVVCFTNEESITRQFKDVKRKSMLYVSADDLDRLKIENPDSDCGILPDSGRMPVTAPFPPASSIVQPPAPSTFEDSTDDLPF